MKEEGLFIAVDFDGTCVKHKYPEIGENVDGVLRVLKKLTDAGHKIILYTMRSGKELVFAKSWFHFNEIPLYGINTNPTQLVWTNSPKAYAHIYIDDAALGCPLVQGKSGERPWVDWDEIEKILVGRGLIL